MSLTTVAYEEPLLITTGHIEDAQLSKGYGTLVSIASASSETLYEDQFERANLSNGTADKSSRVRSRPKFLAGISSAKFWLIFGCVCWNEFMANFDATMMASSHPVITSDFHSSNSASWLSTAFLITSTAFVPIFAPLSDTFGRRPVMLFTSVTLVVGITWCGFASNIRSFIAARTLCGLGAGGTASMGAVIINDFVPIDIRANYQSFLNISSGLGQASGVALGGFLCDTIGWRWAFGIQVPGIVICCGISFFNTPRDLGPQFVKHCQGAVRTLLKTFDLAGTVLLVLSVTSLIYFLNVGGNILPWSHPSLGAALVISVLSACLFVKVEATAEHPVLPLRLIRSWPRANINFANFFGNLIMNGVIFNVPLYFAVVKHDSPTVAGLRLLIPLLSLTASGFLSCMIISRRRAIRPTILFGAVMTLVGAICLSCMRQDVPSWASLLFLLPLSVGQGFIAPASIICLLRTSPLKEYGVATSSFLLWRRLGAVMGVATSTLMVQNLLLRYLHHTITGPHQVEIINRIRKSVHAIDSLSPRHQAQAVVAYATTLRITFASIIIFGILQLAIVIPIKLPVEDVIEEDE